MGADFLQPSQFFLEIGQCSGVVVIVETGFVLEISRFPLVEEVVVEETDTAKVLRQQDFLGICWVESELVRVIYAVCFHSIDRVLDRDFFKKSENFLEIDLELCFSLCYFDLIMPQPLDFQSVKNAFNDAGCVLLETTWINVRHPMRFICDCGKEGKIKWVHFKRGQRCGCRQKLRGIPRRVGLDIAKKIFKDAGCKLLATEYITSQTKMPYICECGKQSEICLANFKSGWRCGCRKKEAGHRAMAKMKATGKWHLKPQQPHTFEYVKKFFEKAGCQLLATEYVDSRIKMPYICECGKQYEISFGNFRSGWRCGCRCGKTAHTLEFVKQVFKKNGIQLLATEYINSKTAMPCICKCGRYAELRYGSVKKGHCCKACGTEAIVQSNQYRPRHSLAYAKLVFEQNGCKLLATEYVNMATSMPYICSCGKQSMCSLQNIERGQKCKECGVNKMIETRSKHLKLMKQIDFLSLPKKIKQRIRELKPSRKVRT